MTLPHWRHTLVGGYALTDPTRQSENDTSEPFKVTDIKVTMPIDKEGEPTEEGEQLMSSGTWGWRYGAPVGSGTRGMFSVNFRDSFLTDENKKTLATPPEEMTVEWLTENYINQTNVEMRRAIMEKLGYDMFAQRMGAQMIDWEGENYELIILNLGGTTGKRPFLKMRNPSIGCYHVEAVGRGCYTVQDALNWRNGMTADMIDDENGAEWFQQGDVIIRPKGATKFKSRPTIIT